MARNQEKSQALFNRFLASKTDKEKVGRITRRPFLATECRDLNEADKWRQQILREVGKKVMEIQNAALGEHRLRDLNDEINKLIREKGHWEKQIRDLGGPDYAGSGPKTSEAIADGSEVEGASGKGQGYRYFGAAKTLPGVKELFQRQAPRTVRRTRHQMFKEINAAYYGFRDEEDGIVVKAEDEAEASIRREAILEHNEKEAEKKAVLETVKGDGLEEDAPKFIAHVPLPDMKDIEQAVLQKKKRDLMARYASATLQAEEEEAKALLNKKSRQE
mmetsp:Transcript_18029/g.30320  ORF Transcript_18029/g.30320 Transcript_18029/m.30320 type:complete len:275 (-) Transcript_18029:125-949(-)|eukprot:CAMPEP_0198200394 /NCGR_PEP_ID=MMETSP1445-20131203/3414_1 /TAXON_ID=36898 /ORGANISM="Pyramimonas sp., Strain CCMP2087" /LENGTH=274 /DNA_ID=CAMNT_0043870451 /DNA_START=142 /DNA_END=966 /DNA_ORIENTATION=+